MFRTFAATTGLVLAQSADRDLKNAPAHCQWHWGEWSVCSKPCGGGTTTRKVVVDAWPRKVKHGVECPENNSETKTCNTHHCPIDATCGWEENMCSNKAGCGTGEQCSFWREKTGAMYGGRECIHDHPAKVCKPCELKPCPIDAVCGFESNMCSNKAGCGTGEQCTFWIEKSGAHHGGRECKNDHPAKKCKPCQLKPCPIDATCGWEENMCSNKAGCGMGEQCSFWIEKSGAHHGGRECIHDHPTKVCKPCQLKPCSIDAVCGFETNMCSNKAGCGTGEQCTFWIEKSGAHHGGRECKNDHPAKTCKPCQLKPCPIDATCGWQSTMCWNKAGCGVGEKCTNWVEHSGAQHGGRECKDDHRSACSTCDLNPCHICDVSAKCDFHGESFSCGARYHWLQSNTHVDGNQAAAEVGKQCAACRDCKKNDYTHFYVAGNSAALGVMAAVALLFV